VSSKTLTRFAVNTSVPFLPLSKLLKLLQNSLPEILSAKLILKNFVIPMGFEPTLCFRNRPAANTLPYFRLRISVHCKFYPFKRAV